MDKDWTVCLAGPTAGRALGIDATCIHTPLCTSIHINRERRGRKGKPGALGDVVSCQSVVGLLMAIFVVDVNNRLQISPEPKI